MTVEQLREAVTAQPFVSFSLVLADGTRHDVKHPELIAIAPKAERTFILWLEGEDYAVIDLFLVSTLEFRKPRGGNGTRRRSA